MQRLHAQRQGLQQQTCHHRPATLPRLAVQPVRADATARVRGDKAPCARVQAWLADVRNWPAWYPGTKSAVKLGNGTEPIRVGAKFEVQRDMLGLKLPMTYEVLEIDPGKRLVLSGLSEHHTQMDQFFFMQDRHDANYCCVRYMTNVQLREWRVYLQPLATRFAAKVPEEAMANLQRVLNISASPIFSSAFEAAFRQEARTSGSSSSSRGAGTTGSSSKGRSSSSSSSSAGKRGLSSGWLKNMLTGSYSYSSVEDEDGASTSSRAGAPVLDPMGYYTLLGLAPDGGEVGEEQIKAAYRRLALQLHPDRHVNAKPAARAAAAAQFARLLAAYDTLRDPEQRALYDAGHLVEASLKL